MRARQKISRAGVELIKSFEGLRATAARLPDGRWTLGYGHTFSAREGARVTQEDADALLRFDLLPIVDAINNLILAPINQNQFDALVSFCFNIGIDNFAASNVLKCLNEGRTTEAALAMDGWRSAEFNGQTYVLAPLIRRRAAEKSLFLTPEDSAGPAPSLLVQPTQDFGHDSGPPPQMIASDRGPDPSPARDAAPAAYAMGQPGLSPYAQPVAQPRPAAAPERQVIDINAFAPRTMAAPAPYAAPHEIVHESLPDTPVPSSAVREVPYAAPAFAVPAPYDAEPQMSPEVQAALARAQEEQRLREETRRQAEAMAAARAGEEARLEQAHREQMRIQQEAFEREARERVAVEAARLEQARQDQIGREQARLEQVRRDEERQDQERRLELERRLEQERQDREREAREKAAAASLAVPIDDEAEKQRKAEAAAALMRLYSPYGGGGMGRSLGTVAKPAGAPAPPAPPAFTPVVAPAPQEFVNHNIMTPAAAVSGPIGPASKPENVAPAAPSGPPAESHAEDDGEVGDNDSVVDFMPAGSPRTVAPPTIVALNPYARPVTPQAPPDEAARPALVEVPRPQPVDLAVNPASAETAAAQPLHWREQLQRPLPENYRNGEGVAAQASLLQTPPASHYESLYQDDNEAWTMDGGRIAVASSDEHGHEHVSWLRMLLDTVWMLIISFLGLGCLGVAAAAYIKSHDPAVIRNGFLNDYVSLSLVMAICGVLFVSISVWLIMKRLGGLKT